MPVYSFMHLKRHAEKILPMCVQYQLKYKRKAQTGFYLHVLKYKNKLYICLVGTDLGKACSQTKVTKSYGKCTLTCFTSLTSQQTLAVKKGEKIHRVNAATHD